MNANHVRRKEIYRLAEHSGLRFDPADAPTNDPKSVDHCRMRVGPDKRIGELDHLAIEYTLCQIFKVHLVDDADARRHHPKPVESLCSPLKEPVSLAITEKFDLHVPLIGRFAAGVVDLDGVIDDKINGN